MRTFSLIAWGPPKPVEAFALRALASAILVVRITRTSVFRSMASATGWFQVAFAVVFCTFARLGVGAKAILGILAKHHLLWLE